MGDEPEKTIDELTEGTRLLAEGLETEVKNDAEKAKGMQPKRPWWKVWARK
jgi:hypothetical protein